VVGSGFSYELERAPEAVAVKQGTRGLGGWSGGHTPGTLINKLRVWAEPSYSPKENPVWQAPGYFSKDMVEAITFALSE